MQTRREDRADSLPASFSLGRDQPAMWDDPRRRLPAPPLTNTGAATAADPVVMRDDVSTQRAVPRHRDDHPLQVMPGVAFIGRQRELGELKAAFMLAAAGQGRCLCLAGEPGIGKTRLAHELAEYAASQGTRILWGRCWESGGAPAYWPWLQVLRGLGSGSDGMSPEAPAVQEALVGLLAGLSTGSASGDAAQQDNPDSELARFRLYDGVTQFLRQVSAARPMVLVFDDLHAADTASLQLLRALCRDLRDMRILVVATLRDAEARSGPSAPLLLGDLARESQRIPLRGLSLDDVDAFIAAIAPAPVTPSLVAAVHQATEGNPFFVDEIMRLWVAEAATTPAGDVGAPPLRIPDEVRQAIRRRLAPLGPGMQRVLSLAAVIGREFCSDVLARILAGNLDENPSGKLPLVSDAPATDVLPQLALAAAAGVVSRRATTASTWRFEHALFRETLYDDLAPRLRAELHGQVGRALESYCPGPNSPFIAALAHHFLQSLPTGDAAPALHYATLAGEQAFAGFAYEEAAQHYEHALGVVRHSTNDRRQEFALLMACGRARERAGECARATALFTRAAMGAREVGDAELFATAILGVAALESVTGTLNDTLIRSLEEALQFLPEGDSLRRASLLGCLAVALYFSAGRERRQALSEEAVAMARRLGDAAALVVALQTRHFALWAPGNADERLLVATELLALGQRLGALDVTIGARDWRTVDLMELGAMRAAREELSRYAQVVDESRSPRSRWHVALVRASMALFCTPLASCEELIRFALQTGQLEESPNAAPFFVIQMFVLHREQGRLSELTTAVRGFVDEHDGLPAWRCTLALLYAETEREGDAQREFDSLVGSEFSSFPRDANWLIAMTLLAEVAVSLGDHICAARLYETLLPHAATNVVIATGIACNGSVARSLGCLAAMQQQWDCAAAHFEEALRANQAMGSPLWVGHTQADFAAMLLRRAAAAGAPAHLYLERATQLLSRAQITADYIGSLRLQRRVERLRAESVEVETNLVRLPVTEDTTIASVFRHEGAYWTVVFHQQVLCLKDTNGMHYLAQLLRQPGQSLHVFELIDLVAHDGDSAAPSPRRRSLEELRDLRDELEAAQQFNDLGRSNELQCRIEERLRALATEAGISSESGGPPHAATEKARVAVTKAIAVVLRAIGVDNPDLRQYLARTIKTGRICSYTPDRHGPVVWSF